jgi:8-oxo-dGTP pyrophosphatase MutT (NUDIX family)
MENSNPLFSQQVATCWPRLDREDLRRRLSQTKASANYRGDSDLEPELTPCVPLRPAAVLILLVDRDDETTIIFTKRTTHLAAHAGQISFPGGVIEANDCDESAAALRETNEEIGLLPDKVDLLGRLDTYITRTGFRVTPFVGVIDLPFCLDLDPFEVADVFEVPLNFFLQPNSLKCQSRVFQGKKRLFYSFYYGNRDIWGATAGMLKNLREVLLSER